MGDELPFTLPTRDLMEQLLHLDLNEPPDFTVRGRELMSLEKILYQFILYQTDRPIRSLGFWRRWRRQPMDKVQLGKLIWRQRKDLLFGWFSSSIS